jgi:hypothetical protein
VLRCSSVVVVEGACVRDYKGIGQMRVLCRVGTGNYSVCGECGGSRGSGVKGRGRRVEEGEDRRRQWKKRTKK